MMEKIAKQQRSKMNKFQICYVQQLLTTESMKRLVMPKNKWVDEGEGDKGGNDRGGAFQVKAKQGGSGNCIPLSRIRDRLLSSLFPLPVYIRYVIRAVLLPLLFQTLVVPLVRHRPLTRPLAVLPVVCMHATCGSCRCTHKEDGTSTK